MTTEARDAPRAPTPLVEAPRTSGERTLIGIFVVAPSLALIASLPIARKFKAVTATDLGLAAAFYTVACAGVTVGYHRLFTHGAFKAKRPLKIALAAAGSLGTQGPVIGWVADHRRHHAFADKEGDPHSPWLFGTSPRALIKGFWHAHMGWLFDKSKKTNQQKFAPDLLNDEDLVRVSKLFPAMTVVNLLAPAVLGGLISRSWKGALRAFFWAGLVRIGFLHHVTWSTNSVCHMVGDRPFESRDKAANFWPLAILSFGESWHNGHHANPSSARHGLLPGQVDLSALIIRGFEKLGWATNVKWPTEEQLNRKMQQPTE